MMLRHGVALLSRSSAAAAAALARPSSSRRLLLPTAAAAVGTRAMGTVTYSPPTAKIGQPAPTFKAVREGVRFCGGVDRSVGPCFVILNPPLPPYNNFAYIPYNTWQGAVVDGEIKQVSLEDYKGSWTVVFFYPKDFTCVFVFVV
jgi:hypothetical protein